MALPRSLLAHLSTSSLFQSTPPPSTSLRLLHTSLRSYSSFPKSSSPTRLFQPCSSYLTSSLSSLPLPSRESPPSIRWPSSFRSLSLDSSTKPAPISSKKALTSSATPTPPLAPLPTSPIPPQTPTLPPFLSRYLPRPIYQPLNTSYIFIITTKAHITNVSLRAVDLFVPKAVVLLYRKNMNSIWEFFRIDNVDKPGEAGKQSPYWRLWEMAKPEKLRLGVGIFLLVVASLCGNILPHAVGEIMDHYGSADAPELTSIGYTFGTSVAILSVVLFVGSLAAMGRLILMKEAGERIIARMRAQAYNSVLHQEIEFTDTAAGTIVSRLSTDSKALGDSISVNLMTGLQCVLMGSIALGAMLWTSVPVTVAGLGMVPITFIVSKKYGEYARRVGKLQQEAIGDMSKLAEEKLSAARTIAAYNAQGLESKNFETRVEKIYQIAKRDIRAHAIIQGFFDRATDHVAELVVVIFGGYMVQKGYMTIGNLTSLLIYQWSFDAAVSGIVGFWAGLNKGLGAGQRVFEIIDRAPQVSPDAGRILSPNRTGTLTLKNIQFAYPSRPQAQILKNISLSIQKGESIAVCGGSGSGKSSIQNLILRFYEPSAGTIEFDGEDIRDFKLDSWRNSIGLVSQESIVFTGSVHDNIAYGAIGGTASREDVEAAAREAGCDFIHTLSNGFDTLVNKSSLSGGQKQRISIARALIRKPKILLLDEATSALDTASEQRVNRAIEKILSTKEITVILVAHRLSSIAQADRVVVVDGGFVVEDGSYDDLSVDPNSKFAKLMASQLVIQDSHEGVAKQPASSTDGPSSDEGSEAGEGEDAEKEDEQPGTKIKEEGVLKGRAASKGGLGK